MFSLDSLKDKMPLVITVAVLLICIISLGIFAWLKLSTPTSKTELNSDWFKGNENGKVVVEVFVDFQCPHCRDFSRDVEKKILQEFSLTSVKYIVRHYTLFAGSVDIAEAAEAAGAQGKFWEYHDLLFAEENLSNLKSQSKREELAKSLNLDMDKFKSETNSHKYRGDVNRDRERGNAYKVEGTPSIFVNGKLVANPSYELIVRAINEQLNAPSSSTSSATSIVTTSTTTETK